MRADALKPVLERLSELGYRFISVTPDTHALVNARPTSAVAANLSDVFGWNRSFAAELLPEGLFQALQAAGGCTPVAGGLWRATFRVASVGHLLFAHSPYPTLERDAVFFGPDSYRFGRAIRQMGATATRAVDVGCGSGVGGILLSHFGALSAPVVLADINDAALAMAGLNAAVAGVPAEVVHSDVLRDIEGSVDLVIANPPYLVDRTARAYRDGGGAHGAALSIRIVKEALARLDRDGGGSLLVYTGVAMLGDGDPFFSAIRDDLERSGARYSYEELDPDIFSAELLEPAYADTERIAAVLLHATLASRGAG